MTTQPTHTLPPSARERLRALLRASARVHRVGAVLVAAASLVLLALAAWLAWHDQWVLAGLATVQALSGATLVVVLVLASRLTQHESVIVITETPEQPKPLPVTASELARIMRSGGAR